MESSVNQNILPVQPLPKAQTPASTSPSNSWSKILLFVTLGLAIVAGLIFTGVQIGKNQPSKPQPVVENPIAIVTTPTPVKDPTVNWATYQLPQLKISFKMPLELNPSEKLDFTTAHANLYWNDSPNSLVTLSATSVKSTFQGGFSYLNGCVGYKESETGYKFLTYTDAEIDMSGEFTKEITNQNKISYLVVKNDPKQIIEGMPPLGVVEKGYIAAIINTNNTEYPALVIQMRLTSTNNESVFDQILSSLKFTD